MTQVTAPFASPLLRATRAIDMRPGPIAKTLTSKQKSICRHLAHEGLSAKEIHAALGLEMHLKTFQQRLREINIKTSTWRRA